MSFWIGIQICRSRVQNHWQHAFLVHRSPTSFHHLWTTAQNSRKKQKQKLVLQNYEHTRECHVRPDRREELLLDPTDFFPSNETIKQESEEANLLSFEVNRLVVTLYRASLPKHTQVHDFFNAIRELCLVERETSYSRWRNRKNVKIYL